MQVLIEVDFLFNTHAGCGLCMIMHSTCSITLRAQHVGVKDICQHALWMQEVNLETGYVCGSMRADNVPQAKTPVVTFWEGDIIDNVNHSFITSKWGADKKIDVCHWPRFDGFLPLRQKVHKTGGRYDNICHIIEHNVGLPHITA